MNKLVLENFSLSLQYYFSTKEILILFRSACLWNDCMLSCNSATKIWIFLLGAVDFIKWLPLSQRSNLSPPLAMFFLSPQNQKESNQSHLVNLKYILFPVISMKKSGVPPGEVSRQRWRVRGGCHLRKVKVAILKILLIVWSWNLLCITNAISFSSKSKPDEIPIFRTF